MPPTIPPPSPILRWSAVDCGRFIEAEGLARNPVVDTLHRSGECLCGAFAQAREIHDIDLWYPHAGEVIHELERRVEASGKVQCLWATPVRDVSPDQLRAFPVSPLLCQSCEARS